MEQIKSEIVKVRKQDFEKAQQAVWSLNPLRNQINFGFVGMLKNLKEANTFYNNAKDIDFINKFREVNLILKKYPNEFRADYEIKKYLIDFTIDFPNWLNEQKVFLKNEINNAMMESNNLRNRSNNLLENAINMAKAAQIISETCLILYPDDNEFLKLRETTINNYQKLSFA